MNRDDVHRRILNYCADNRDVGDISQASYKREFFLIFRDAYQAGIRSSADEENSVSDDSIHTYAVKANWITEEESEESEEACILDEVSTWWEEWCYAWDRFDSVPPL